MQDPAILFAPYGLKAEYGYPPYGAKGSKIITLEVWETDASLEEDVAPQWQPVPDSYGAKMILQKSQPPRVVVSGDGITAALSNPQKFAAWVKQTCAFITSRIHTAIAEENKRIETLLRVGHRNSADELGVSRAVPGGQPPTPKQLLQARNDSRVAEKRSGSVGDGSDQGVLL